MKRRILKWCKKSAAIAAVVFLVCLNYSNGMRQIRRLPDILYITETTNLENTLPKRASAVTVDAQQAERLADVTDTSYTFRLFGVLPLRTVQLVRARDAMLIPGGQAVGITLHTAGVLVVGIGSVDSVDGVKSPAAAAGLVAGDIILRANGETLHDAEHFANLCAAADDSMQLDVRRENKNLQFTLYPVRDAETGENRIGAWVRDSTAGIGTLSFANEELRMFAALGHAVSDIDTQSTLPVGDGELLRAEVMDVIRGTQGEPGELLGVFSPEERGLGSITDNTEFGIFGTLSAESMLYEISAVPMAYAYEVHTGDAQLLATVDGNGVQSFACEITRANVQSAPAAKGMIVTVTDDRLLDATGGIVQGMSGSPILQDGKLVGVVTHVFVNDPTKGYCIYAEWMLQQMLSCSQQAAE